MCIGEDYCNIFIPCIYHTVHNVSDPFTGTTRRVENVSLGGGGEKHRTDKRGETERALETTLHLHPVSSKPFKVIQAVVT